MTMIMKEQKRREEKRRKEKKREEKRRKEKKREEKKEKRKTKNEKEKKNNILRSKQKKEARLIFPPTETKHEREKSGETERDKREKTESSYVSINHHQRIALPCLCLAWRGRGGGGLDLFSKSVFQNPTETPPEKRKSNPYMQRTHNSLRMSSWLGRQAGRLAGRR